MRETNPDSDLCDRGRNRDDAAHAKEERGTRTAWCFLGTILSFD